MDSRQDINHKDYWYNRDKYVILGFATCGTTLLSKYLRCGHPELGYNGTEEYLKNYSQCIPVFITRKPVERLWQLYVLTTYFNGWEYDRFLDFKNDKWNVVGVNDGIAQSDYDKYIEPFKEFGVITYKFEDMLKDSDFTKHLKTPYTGINIPNKFRELVEKRLDKAHIKY